LSRVLIALHHLMRRGGGGGSGGAGPQVTGADATGGGRGDACAGTQLGHRPMLRSEQREFGWANEPHPSRSRTPPVVEGFARARARE
jgi:hypothetical protein